MNHLCLQKFVVVLLGRFSGAEGSHLEAQRGVFGERDKDQEHVWLMGASAQEVPLIPGVITSLLCAHFPS